MVCENSSVGKLKKTALHKSTGISLVLGDLKTLVVKSKALCNRKNFDSASFYSQSNPILSCNLNLSNIQTDPKGTNHLCKSTRDITLLVFPSACVHLLYVINDHIYVIAIIEDFGSLLLINR